MGIFRLHRMKENPRQQFRWAPHTSGATQIKPRDFDPGCEFQAASFYDAWTNLRGSENSLQVGDVLESESGEIRILKYVGFEEARWWQPELRQPEAAGTDSAFARTEESKTAE